MERAADIAAYLVVVALVGFCAWTFVPAMIG
jgi:hypothetical protein